MKQPSRSKRASGDGRGAPGGAGGDEFDGLSPEMRRAIENIGSDVLREPIPERLLRAARRLAQELHAKRTGTED